MNDQHWSGLIFVALGALLVVAMLCDLYDRVRNRRPDPWNTAIASLGLLGQWYILPTLLGLLLAGLFIILTIGRLKSGSDDDNQAGPPIDGGGGTGSA